MNRSQWATITGVVVLIIACFMPWVRIASVSLELSGVDTKGTLFGKPGYLHFVFALLILVCTFIPAVWAKRFNLLFAAINLGWGLRNMVVMGRCEAGDCPEKQTGLYLVMAGSLLIMIAVLFPRMKLDETARK